MAKAGADTDSADNQGGFVSQDATVNVTGFSGMHDSVSISPAPESRLQITYKPRGRVVRHHWGILLCFLINHARMKTSIGAATPKSPGESSI